MLVNKMKPKEICTAIKLCSAASFKSKQHVPGTLGDKFENLFCFPQFMPNFSLRKNKLSSQTVVYFSAFRQNSFFFRVYIYILSFLFSVKSVGSIVTCEACQLVVQYVDSLLKNKKTEVCLY